MIQIKLLKDWKNKKVGDILNLSEKGAQQFIDDGAGEYVLQEIKKKVTRAEAKAIIKERFGVKIEKNEDETMSQEVLEKFKDKNLLEQIEKEISKDHLEDDNLKMTVHLTHVSGLLKNPKRRQSLKITGKTSEGKDNIQQASLKHLPDGSYIFVTSATQSVLEDDIKDIPILAISELNLFREMGANKNLLEVIKQRTEGGTSAVKKDLRTNNQTLRFEEGEQGTVTFGTTEFEDDEELGTRLMCGTIKATPKRIKIVNDNTLEAFSDETKILNQLQKKDSWIKKGYSLFWKNSKKYEVVIPYAKFLKEEFEGKPIFDNSDARSQRDIKRLLSLTCAMTWIFQEQREKKEINGTWFLISEPIDFINTLKYSNEFFNQTYSGMEQRVHEALKFIDSKGKDVWIDKLEIQEHLGIKHRDTINKYLWELEQKAFIERSKGVQLNERFGLNTYKGNHIYYTSVQKAFNKRLISVQLEKLKDFLESKCSKISVQFNKNEGYNQENIPKIEEKGVSEVLGEVSQGENEHLKLNASDLFPFTPEEIASCGYNPEDLEAFKNE